MSEEKKNQMSKDNNEEVVKEIDLEEAGNITGGSIRDVSFTKTKPISEDTKSKI